QHPALWHRLARHHQYRVRRAVEQGWQAVAGIRAGRQAETAQGYQLVVLLENADLLIARTVALAEHFEAESDAKEDSPCFDRILSGLVDLRSVELWVAALLMRRRGQTAAHVRAKLSEMGRLPHYLAGCPGAADATGRFLLAQITEAASLLETSIESAAMLRLGKATEIRTAGASASTGHFAYVHERLGLLRQGWNLDQLAANFTPQSLTLRHAARVSLVCGLDVTLILLLHIDHGYWLLLTSLIVLQPHVSGTLRRGMERIGGTVGGGMLAALLAVALHSQLATAAVLFPLALLSLAILPVSYAAFAFFLTPAFVLAWLPYSGDWQLALVRTLNTIVGALIAIAAMIFLFPAYERNRAPRFLRASLAADRRYLAQLAEAWTTSSQGRSRSSRALASARRATGLAHNDTEESLERLLAESWPRRRPFAQFATAFVTYLRRFAQSVTTLATLDGEWAWKQSGPVQSRLDLLDRRLAWLEEQTVSSQTAAPTPWPEPGTLELHPPVPLEDHLGERQLERLERQVEILQRQLRSLREHGWLPGAGHS
ncbi:MAG: FUSC family protein, partial [Terracidiphilus sp.]